jgi:putative transposase
MQLLRQNLAAAAVRILGWCLMTNHIHLIGVPEREDSLSVLLRRVQGRYAQYFNVHAGRTGHLWQNRFFACALGPSHQWSVIAYVERNPVRAGMVRQAAEYRWSSARAHLTGTDADGIVDMEWWRREALSDWAAHLAAGDEVAEVALRQCTYAGRPYGEEAFAEGIAKRFGRYWQRGRPRKEKRLEGLGRVDGEQIALF